MQNLVNFTIQSLQLQGLPSFLMQIFIILNAKLIIVVQNSSF